FRISLREKFYAMKHLPLILILCLAACTSSRNQLKKETDDILKRANQSFLQSEVDTNLIDSAYTSIENFVASFPDDTVSPAFLLEKALLYEKQSQFPKTMLTLERIYSKYPASRQASKAIFLEGFLYANVLQQYDKAKEKYQLYLDKYSSVDPKMTNDVKTEIENLGKTPDQILE